MASNVSWRDVLSPELVRQIDDEIDRQFAEGWRACQRMVAASEPHRSDIQPSKEAEHDGRQYPRERAPRGFWAGLLEQEAYEHHPRELLFNDAMRAVQSRTDEFELSRSSLLAAVTTLERDGKLRKEGQKLLLFPRSVDKPNPPEAAETHRDEDQPAVAPSFRESGDVAA